MEKVREVTAYHEAGHAVGAWLFGHGFKRIVLHADGGATIDLHPPPSSESTAERVRKQILVGLLGWWAVLARWGSINAADIGSDHEEISRLALLHPKVDGDPSKGNAYLAELSKTAERISQGPAFPAMVRELAKVLLEKDELTWDEAELVIGEALDEVIRQVRPRTT